MKKSSSAAMTAFGRSFLLVLDVLGCKMMASAMLFFEKMKLIH